MKFSIFKSAKAQKGEECTYEKFLEVTESAELERLCREIAKEGDEERRGEMKKRLPAVTWQAYFSGRRVAGEAEPSGLFMLDIDHVEDPWKLYCEKVSGRVKELGIVFVGKTASTRGLRIVAKCLPTLHTIEECQRWLASNLKVDYDGVCKDWARCSFLVHSSYTYYMDGGAIWQEEAAEGTQYAAGKRPVQENGEMMSMLSLEGAEVLVPAEKIMKQEEAIDQREGLFGGQTEYRGVKLEVIAREWLEQTGGMPEKGERNQRLYKLALRMRYLTDFNAATMMRVMPKCGLMEEEVQRLVHSALSATRAADVPQDMQKVLDNIDKRIKLTGEVEMEDDDEGVMMPKEQMPPMPPIIRQFCEIAPDDFKVAVVLCQLPILGALGSRLRSRYMDGQMHSPSFQVSLEAPQASGKSFMRKLVEIELSQLLEHDEEQRERERDYDAKVREMKLLNIKVDTKNKEEVLGSRPKSLIRFVPATMSITKLLMRMNDAQGLHLFAFAEEIDTVTKAFKRGFSSYSDLLRVAFDNGLYGQDYASENTFSGIIPIYYNMLSSGTPKAMRRFYPDVEDGLVSRVCFVTLPDQFGKRMPVWKEMNAKQREIVDVGLVKLNEISIQGDEVQGDHVMRLDWLNAELEKWVLSQQSQAVGENDRTRDVFCPL